MRRKIGIATVWTNAAEFYKKQIEEIFGDQVLVEKYCFDDDSIKRGIEADLVLTHYNYSLEAIKKHIKNDSEIIMANRTISKEGFNKLKKLKNGTEAMLVNVNAEMAINTVSLIYQLNLRHISIVPVYPGMKETPKLDIAITPGESKYVPEGVKEIIDIGDRVLDISTIMDIAIKLDIYNEREKENIKKHFEQITPVFGMEKIIGKTNRLESQLDILMQIFDEGIVAVDSDGIVRSYNKSVEQIINYERDDIIGRKAVTTLPEIPFDKVLESIKPEKEKLRKINGCDVVLDVYPITNHGTVYGAISTVRRYSDTERKQQKLRAQLIGKGHCAKHTFQDIKGSSPEIKKAKEIAKRMAKSESSVVIAGESGTGKELFAQAMHNHSKRKGHQFVAINCAALPESLLESELFGYQEGAFTGARKGGKPGLFELSHLGTLLLDEIGEVPLGLQARLLRVLQEQEVMRIGGDSVIKVDVRIIAATNRDLNELVKLGKFRQDLYFRLHVLPLKIPPLRDRKVDIIPLVEQLKFELNANFNLSKAAEEKLTHHKWEGNVRELRNYIDYLSNLGKETVDIKDLPFTGEAPYDEVRLTKEEKFIINRLVKSMGNQLEICILVLQTLLKNYNDRKRMGRRMIAKEISEQGYFISEQEVRTIIMSLESFSMVEVGRGRKGTEIKDLGRKVCSYFSCAKENSGNIEE